MRNDRTVESFANMSENRQNKAFLWASEVHAVLKEVELKYKLCTSKHEYNQKKAPFKTYRKMH